MNYYQNRQQKEQKCIDLVKRINMDKKTRERRKQQREQKLMDNAMDRYNNAISEQKQKYQKRIKNNDQNK